jgi:hypothetical protein
MGKDVNYRKRPAEDFARATIEYEAGGGERLVGEVTTSWSFVGAGLRLSASCSGRNTDVVEFARHGLKLSSAER